MPNSHTQQNSHGNPSTAAPSDVESLLRLITRDPGRPRLTWYGDDGERVELSGAVLENWVNKVSNLLVEEFDAAPGTRLAVDLPVHWRTVLWALAGWRVGATLSHTGMNDAEGADTVKNPRTDEADVVITSRPASWNGTRADVVAVALPALARRFDDELPPGAVDAASGVMTYGDQLGWVPAVEPDAPAVLGEGTGDVLHGDLVTTALAAAGVRPGARVLVRGDASPRDVVRSVLGVLAADGSVVLLSERRTAELDADGAARRRISETERITDAEG